MGRPELEWDLKAYARRAEGVRGGRVMTIDGHDLKDIDRALADRRGRPLTGSTRRTPASRARARVRTRGRRPRGTRRWVDRPTVILARAIKGRGFAEVENHEEVARQAVPDPTWPPGPSRNSAVNATCWSVVRARRPDRVKSRARPAGLTPMPTYSMGDRVATRKAYGDALAALGSRDERMVALDGEVGNSTHADEFARAFPDRYFEMFIAEQQMLGSAMGLAAARLPAVRLDVRRVPDPGPRLHPEGAPSPSWTYAWSGRTPGSRSGRTDRRRWVWRTSP